MASTKSEFREIKPPMGLNIIRLKLFYTNTVKSRLRYIEKVNSDNIEGAFFYCEYGQLNNRTKPLKCFSPFFLFFLQSRFFSNNHCLRVHYVQQIFPISKSSEKQQEVALHQESPFGVQWTHLSDSSRSVRNTLLGTRILEQKSFQCSEKLLISNFLSCLRWRNIQRLSRWF